MRSLVLSICLGSAVASAGVLTVPPTGRVLTELVADLDANGASIARGQATFRMLESGMVSWQLAVEDLSGFATGVHVRAGDATIFTLTNPPATGVHVGGLGPLTDDEQRLFHDQALQIVVETADHPEGEISGPVRLLSLPDVTCDCAGADAKAAFKRCVRRGMKRLARVVRKTAPGKSLLRSSRLAACGPPPRREKPNRIACCLARNPLGNVVIEPLCVPVTSTQCGRLGGTAAAESSCWTAAPCG